MKKHLSAIAAGLFFLFWFACLTSQSLMDLADGLLFLFGAALLFSKARAARDWKLLWPNTTGLGWLWLVWICVVAAGLFINNPVEPDTINALLEFRWMLIFQVLCFTLAWIEWDARKVQGMLGVLLVMVLASFVIFYFEKGDFRAGGPFGHSMPFAHSYGAIVVFAVGILLIGLKNSMPWKWLSLVTTLLGAVIIALSMTRGVWVGMFIGVVGISCFRSRLYGIIVSVGLVAVFALTMVFSQDARERALTTNSASNVGDNQRKDIWRGNLEIVKDYPVLGSGYSQNKKLLRFYYDKLGIPPGALISHAHNQYLHFLAGTGALGLICYLIFLFRVIQLTLLAYIRLKPEFAILKALTLGALGGQVCFIIGSLTESNFSIAKNRYVFLLLSAIGVSIYYRYVARTEFEKYRAIILPESTLSPATSKSV